MNRSKAVAICLVAISVFCLYQPAHSQAADPDYARVAAILNEYCAGCHNDSDREGDLSLSSFQSLMAGTPEGAIVISGKPAESKLIQVLTGVAEPVMPPEDEPRPTPAEIELLRSWVVHGAVVPAGDSPAPFHPPQLQPAEVHYIAAACKIGPDAIAAGELGRIVARRIGSDEVLWQIDGLAGKVNSLRLSSDGRRIVVGSGVTGSGGEVLVVDAHTGDTLSRWSGHADTVYCAAMSPDGRWVASGSYDRTVILWEVETGQIVRQFNGHNGAIYDLDFSPAGDVLATASADQTVKLWNVRSGERLDTLGQPEGEMHCVRFSPDGQSVIAAGADRQIRRWKLLSTQQPAINPMLDARFAHESGILQLEFVGDDWLLSTAEDRTVKLWGAAALDSRGQLVQLEDVPVAVVAGLEDEQVAIVELTGKLHYVKLAQLQRLARQSLASRKQQNSPTPRMESVGVDRPATPTLATDKEPNDLAAQATACVLPATIEGVIDSGQAAVEDVDHFRFTAQAGETWIFEVTAASNKSKLDSWIDVLDARGRPVVRTRLQAVRESYFTFRGKDSATSDDFRLHKWEDMELDEFLYSSGEVTKLWLYPRGPDSGFKVYPGFGNRYTFFGTTPVAHALGEPAYVVRELVPGAEALPNGLPVFPIYFENDDDPLRRDGSDSRLEFVAPATGEYVLRVRDARGFDGPEFKYRVGVRRPAPDFEITVSGHKMSMPKGSGREWKVQATRIDGLDAPIVIELDGLPEGFLATNPLIIEAGQETALGTIYATREAILPTQSEAAKEPLEATGPEPAPVEAEGQAAGEAEYATVAVKLLAHSHAGDKRIEHAVDQQLELTLNDSAEVQFTLRDAADSNRELEELTIRPGQTISARIIVDRKSEAGSISFGKEDSGRNLPHGAYVDNIGLNGLLIPEGQTQREFFITAAPILEPCRRQFHLRTEAKGNATSRPLWLNVLPAAGSSATD